MCRQGIGEVGEQEKRISLDGRLKCLTTYIHSQLINHFLNNNYYEKVYSITICHAIGIGDKLVG